MTKLVFGVNDFKTWCEQNNRADLLAEWDNSKNLPITPNGIAYGTAKKCWWIGKCGHSYQASMNKRTSDNTACPYCSDSHAKLLKGFNDLATTNPELLPCWDYEKNGVITPQEVMKGQHKLVWWKCPIGHSYQAMIYHRVQGRGCPVCRRENQTSFPEQALLYYIKSVFTDALSSDRKILDGKELDIYIPSIQVAIEFDGSKWHKKLDKDIAKNELCKQKGITLIRIRDVDCPALPESDDVYIISHEKYSDDELNKCILEVARVLNVTFDIDLDRDRVLIYNQYYSKKKEKSLAESYPELCKEWNYKKNGNLTPELLTRKSDKKVWWVGKCGHEWPATVSSRTQMQSGCPYCSGRLLIGFNDLATLYPELGKLFDAEKNNMSASEISRNTKSSYYWKCSKGHSYKKHLFTMQKNINDLDKMCPYCNPPVKRTTHESKVKTRNTYKSISFTLDLSHPDSLNDWDFDKNTINPSEVTIGTKKKVWWKCSKGHSYLSTPSNHISLNRSCPFCSGRKVLKGYNDFATEHPELLNEWDYNKNTIMPDEVTSGSGKDIWWICSKGHSYKYALYQRTAGHSCPTCAGCKKRRVRNMDTGEVFNSLNAAGLSCGLKVGDTISLCCQGKMHTAGGYHWEYVDE